MKICFRIPRAYIVAFGVFGLISAALAVAGAFWTTVRILESEPDFSVKRRTRIEPLP